MGGKGKDGKGGKDRDRPREVAGPRRKVGAGRFTGVVQEWKGKFGWIEPDQPIDHPEARKKRGKVFLAQEDVEEDLSGIGCRVSFFVYADGTGLGAMHCVPAGSGAGRPRPAPGPQRSVQKPPAPAPGRPKAAAPMRPPPGGAKAPAKTPQPSEDARRSRPPDAAARTTISAAPVQGKVVEWRGKFGFISPDEPLDIPELEDRKKLGKRAGQIYCHAVDVEGEIPLRGAVVIFFVYSDPTGIGAEMCQVVEQGEADASAASAAATDAMEEEPAADAEDADAGGEEDGQPARARDRPRTRGGKGRQKDGKGKGEGKKSTGPSGPDLPRTRVSDVPVTGEVKFWHDKGKFGWIKPLEEIDHPDMSKHKGDIYVHMKDLIGVEALEKGQTVQFVVFSDVSGLGAEEVSLL